MNDPLRPFRILRPSWRWFDLVGFWFPWIKSALWWWKSPR